MVTGTTSSKLEQTKGYDGKYEAGRNGLIEINSTHARYRLGNILYIDDFVTKTTTFYYLPEPAVLENPIMASDSHIDALTKIEDNTYLQRNEIGPFEAIYKLSIVANSNIEQDFPTNFF